jgi:hypothetical protein
MGNLVLQTGPCSFLYLRTSPWKSLTSPSQLSLSWCLPFYPHRQYSLLLIHFSPSLYSSSTRFGWDEAGAGRRQCSAAARGSWRGWGGRSSSAWEQARRPAAGGAERRQREAGASAHGSARSAAERAQAQAGAAAGAGRGRRGRRGGARQGAALGASA